jgi:hypothetical protein
MSLNKNDTFEEYILNNIKHFLINDSSNTIIVMQSFIHYSETLNHQMRKKRKRF